MKIGIISDLHLVNKTNRIERAISMLHDIDLLLIVGDIADRAEKQQYALLQSLLTAHMKAVPVCCVSGNHDNPARDDTNYRQFACTVNGAYPSVVDGSGAFFVRINDNIDLIGLNPEYHQKRFFFPNKGQQLDFLQQKLFTSTGTYHIVLCHPPLIFHNTQRTADMAPYMEAAQDQRLQQMLDSAGNVIFISGHTHMPPTVEHDRVHHNLYISDGSICPVQASGESDAVQQGNVILLDICGSEITVTALGLHSHTALWKNNYNLL